MSKVIKNLESYEKAKAKVEKLRLEAAALEKAADEFRVNNVRRVSYKQTSRYVFEVDHLDGRKLKYNAAGDILDGKKKIGHAKNVHEVRFLIAMGEI